MGKFAVSSGWWLLFCSLRYAPFDFAQGWFSTAGEYVRLYAICALRCIMTRRNLAWFAW
jgi:hypothetical protein